MFRIFIGASFIGLAPLFVKLVSMEPTPIVIYRCGIAAIILWAIGARTFRPWKWNAKSLFLLFLAGALFALDLIVWHRSVIYAGAGIATILANTQVFYVALIGIVFHKDKLTALFVLSVLMAFIGIYLLVGVNFFQIDERYKVGVLLGLATGVIYTSYLLTLRKFETTKVGISTQQGLIVISATAALVALSVSSFEGSFRLPMGNEWIWLPSLAIISQVCGWLLITKGLTQTSFSRAGILLSMQPVVAILGGTLLFHESLSLIQGYGAVLTLMAIYLGSRKS